MARQRQTPAPVSLQESILSVLALDEKWGAQIAAQVTDAYFDETYRPLAALLLNYRTQYHRPPGRAHLDDLIDLSMPADKQAEIQRQLGQLVAQAEEGLNAEYVAHKTAAFVRRQTLKRAVLQAGDRYQQGGEDMEDEVEQILYGALRAKHLAEDVGLFLSDKRGLEFLDKTQAGYGIGIHELDKRGVGPAAGQLLLYIGPKGSGKSWFCVHVGRHCRVTERLKVTHITLEMSELLCFQRYYQNLFGVAKTSEAQRRTLLEFDELNRLVGLKKGKLIKPKLSLQDPKIRSFLASKQKAWGMRLGGLVIKRFPTGQLTLPALIAYLDMLEAVHNFVPQVLIVDYPDLMKTDPNNYRHSLGGIYEGLRGIAVERNLAAIAPSQGNRSTLSARYVKSSDVSEDIRKINTADNVLTYSRTDAEERRGLARLHCAHARDAAGGFTVLLNQNYSAGQYVIESTLMQSAYWDLMNAKEDE